MAEQPKSWLVVLSRHRDQFLAVVEDKEKLRSHLINNKGTEISAIEHVEKINTNQKRNISLQPEFNKATM
jgi:hypothetical protein